MQRKLDIFISYRRADGAKYARILQLKLIERGYRVFLDYDELTDGIFGENIRKAIDEAPIFISILSPHYLDRCTNEHDWVRNEFKLALQKKKYFIFVNPDKTFDGIPGGTPEDIAKTIGCIQHSEISFGEALEATVDFLVTHRIEPILGNPKEKASWLSRKKSNRTISDIFISYSRDDKSQVHPFSDYISTAVSRNCWIDLKGIESGEEFEDVIMKAIDECQVVLFMLSDRSLNSKWTKREVLYAESEGKRIVPVLVNGDKLRGWFKFHFGNVDFININSEEQKIKLVKNLRTWLGVKEEEHEEGTSLPNKNENTTLIKKDAIRKYPKKKFLVTGVLIVIVGIVIISFLALASSFKDIVAEENAKNEAIQADIDDHNMHAVEVGGIYGVPPSAFDNPQKMNEVVYFARYEQQTATFVCWYELYSITDGICSPEQVRKYFNKGAVLLFLKNMIHKEGVKDYLLTLANYGQDVSFTIEGEMDAIDEDLATQKQIEEHNKIKAMNIKDTIVIKSKQLHQLLSQISN